MKIRKAALLKPGDKIRVPRLWNGEFVVEEVVYRERAHVRIYGSAIDKPEKSRYDIGIHVNGEYMLVDCKYVKKA